MAVSTYQPAPVHTDMRYSPDRSCQQRNCGPFSELSPRSNEKTQVTRTSQSTTGYNQDKQEFHGDSQTSLLTLSTQSKIPRKIKGQGWPLFKGETTNGTDPCVLTFSANFLFCVIK